MRLKTLLNTGLSSQGGEVSKGVFFCYRFIGGDKVYTVGLNVSSRIHHKNDTRVAYHLPTSLEQLLFCGGRVGLSAEFQYSPQASNATPQAFA